MRRSPNSHPKPGRLSPSLQKRLTAYSMMAGVGACLLTTNTVQAEVVYTPTNVSIMPGQTVALDLNNDGIVDFNFVDQTFASSFNLAGFLSVIPVGGNGVWGHASTFGGMASALLPDALIGAPGQFYPGNQLMAADSFNGGAHRKQANHPAFSISTCNHPWAFVANRYLGFKFLISGQVHYGWASLGVQCNQSQVTVEAKLTGYAYETVANRSIVAGVKNSGRESAAENNQRPITLWQLAQGASGIFSDDQATSRSEKP